MASMSSIATAVTSGIVHLRVESTITIDPKTGYRTNVPVSILRVDSRKRFVIGS